MIAAVVWGFAEATLFFLVPDILLSLVALRACLAAVGGALAGGLLMFWWGHTNAPAALVALDFLPAISPGMLAAVAQSLEQQGYLAMLWGPMSGTPYKIYAVQAGALGLSLPVFLLMTVSARLMRFLAVTLLVAFVARRLLAAWSPAAKFLLTLCLWCGFYILYFVAMPN